MKFKGTTYRMKGSRCFINLFAGTGGGARLYFGAQSWNRPPPARLNGLYLVVDRNGMGTFDVVDGGVDLAARLRAAIVGTARATSTLSSGTFTIFGHVGNGKTDSRRFTGSWHCD